MRRGGWIAGVVGLGLLACERPPEPPPEKPAPAKTAEEVVAKAPAAKQPAVSASASTPTPAPTIHVVDLVATKEGLFSPWTMPDLGKLGVPSALPSGLPLPSAFPSGLPAGLPSTLTLPSGLPTLVPWPTATTPPPPPGPSLPTPKPTTPTPPPKKAPYVVLYGAGWCGYCKEARAHIEGRKIVYTYRDVDQADANAEMATKLKAAGKSGGGIPTTDVGGDLLIGWNAKSFDAMYDAKAK